MLMKFMNPKVGIWALVFACSCLILGCGSDNGSGVSASRKDQTPPVKKKPQVVELLTNGPSGQGTPKKLGVSREMEGQIIEVTPPDVPGGIGVTQQEVDALKASQNVDPQTIEVILPSKPGERGLTQREVDALRVSQDVAPQDIEVLPPSKPGERGLTQREIDAIKASQK